MDNKVKAVIREYAESLLIAFILAMIIRTFVVQAFKIPTGSMRPTLIEGDRILVNKFIYKFKEPKRGDIIVFKYPEDPKLDFIKRLIGLSNESVEIKNGKVYINGKLVEEKALLSKYYYNRGDYGQIDKSVVIPKDSYFAMGDNSGNSRDSRYWGFVPKKNLIGKAILIYWPPYRMRLLE
jgi:signal peptidase I